MQPVKILRKTFLALSRTCCNLDELRARLSHTANANRTNNDPPTGAKAVNAFDADHRGNRVHDANKHGADKRLCYLGNGFSRKLLHSSKEICFKYNKLNC